MSGRLAIAGLGPGGEALVTPEVQDALAQATDVIGYIPYVARVAPRPGLTLHASDNRVERARAEQALAVKVGALSERFEQMEKDQAGRVAALTAQIDKRLTPPAPAPVAAKAAPEPTETGAIAHAAPKPATDNWAVREVYDGVAVLEDRKRRLVEVGIGDTIPGIGRVDSIERRGRTWAVVTRQGVITAQTW